MMADFRSYILHAELTGVLIAFIRLKQTPVQNLDLYIKFTAVLKTTVAALDFFEYPYEFANRDCAVQKEV